MENNRLRTALATRDNNLAAANAAIADRDMALREKGRTIERRNRTIKAMEKDLANCRRLHVLASTAPATPPKTSAARTPRTPMSSFNRSGSVFLDSNITTDAEPMPSVPRISIELSPRRRTYGPSITIGSPLTGPIIRPQKYSGLTSRSTPDLGSASYSPVSPLTGYPQSPSLTKKRGLSGLFRLSKKE